MPAAYRLAVGEAETATVDQLRAHGPKADLRERAAVLLAVARATAIRQAAQRAGLTAHDADTVWAWVARDQTQGVAGVWIRAGRGRKPAALPPRR
jgi:hypothetical protein